jgi:hypothetical protein
MVSESTGNLYLGIKYNYHRKMPPPNAEYVISLDPYRFVDSDEYIWLSELPWTTTSVKIAGQPNNLRVYDETEIILERQGFAPVGVARTINGGVVNTGGNWTLEWDES